MVSQLRELDSAVRGELIITAQAPQSVLAPVKTEIKYVISFYGRRDSFN